MDGFCVSTELVSDPEPFAFADACGFGFCSLGGVVSDAASRAESSDPVRLPPAFPLAAACLLSPETLGSVGKEPPFGAVGAAGADGDAGAASFMESSEPVRLPVALPSAAPLMPDNDPLAAPAALPAPLALPAIPLVAAFAAPLAAPVTDAFAEDAVDEAVLCAVSRVDAARSRTRPVVSRVRSMAPEV